MFTYQWEHEGRPYMLKVTPDEWALYVDRGTDFRTTFRTTFEYSALIAEFKHLVEENKRLQEGK